MKLQARILRAGASCGVTIALGLTLWGCGESPTPTHPSTSLPGASVTATGFGSAANLTVTWSCVTQGVGCPARLGQLTPNPGALTGTAPGSPGNLMSSVNGSTVNLGWLGPTSGDQPTSYVIEAGSAPGLSNIVVFDTGTAAGGFTATSVPTGTYYVRVRAKNAAGTSGPSNEVIVTVGSGSPPPCIGALLGTPTNLAVSINGSTATFTWNATAGIGGCAPTEYSVVAGSTPGTENLGAFLTGSTATTFSAADVPAGTYYVRVRGVNLGYSPSSNEVTVIVGSSTPSPTSVTGRWVGVTPDGMDLGLGGPDRCEYDLQLDLTQSGTAVTGTSTTRDRKTVGAAQCDAIGHVETHSLMNGRVGSGTISFSLPADRGGTVDFSGTFTATRMAGTLVGGVPGGGGRGSFAVNRQ